MEDLIFLKNFATYSEAELARNFLKANGFKSVVIQKGNIAAASLFTGWTGDADVFVLRKDYNRAKELLEI
ncbi:MAG: hypothetical protein V1892_00255 [bacterium]